MYEDESVEIVVAVPFFKCGQQVGVIVYGDGNKESEIAYYISRGFKLVGREGFACIHKPR